ncbi:MAG: O-antigen ligase family protein, partial [Thermoanaerobaculia bacterium]
MTSSHRQNSSPWGAIGFTLLLALAAGAPFPYGAVLPAGELRIELAAFGCLALAFLSRPWRGWLGEAAFPAAAVGAIAAVGLLQLVPLSESALAQISPISAKIYHETAEILGSAQPKISIAPTDTVRTILLTLAYLALFFAAAILLRTRTRRRVFAAVLVGASAIEIAVSALSAGVEERLHGPFINPDHFAGYLEISLALAFGTLWREILTGGDSPRGIEEGAARMERRILRLGGWILLWGFLASGVVLTRSRGGILAASLTALGLVAGGLASRRRAGRLRTLTAAGVALLFGLLFVAGATKREAILRFLASDPRDMGADLRVGIWKTSIEASRSFPILGSGLGSFREAFRRFQPRGMEGLVEQAHCDALQLLVTGGWVGLALGILLVGSLFAALARALARQRHREEKAFVLAGMGALASLVLHGLVDFNMSIPAIPATLAAVLGAAWAAGRDERGRE